MTAREQDANADVPSGSVRVHASMPPGDRRSRSAAILSFVLHALLILIAIRLTAAVTLPEHSPLGDAIQMVLGGGGGGGGPSGAAFKHAPKAPIPTPVPPPPPVVPPPPPPPPVVVPTVIPPPVIPPAPAVAPGSATVAAGGSGTGTGGGKGSGVGTGNGSGEGPGSGSGKGGGAGGGNGGVPPENKQMILPPTDVPKELRGKPIEVTFTVDSAGVVTGVVVTPPIENHNYARRFVDAMRGYRFTPARNADGRSVAGVAKYEVTLGSK